MEDPHAAGVVNMVVRNQNRIDGRYVPAVQFEPLLGLNSADPRVEQQLDTVRLDVDAVAVAAGLERNDSHGRIVQRIGEEHRG